MLETDEWDLYTAAKYYTQCGIIVHPLYRGDEKSKRCKSPGKQPILKQWQKLVKPLDNEKLQHFFKERKCNLGAVCGKASDLTAVDVDWIVKGIWEDIFSGIDKAGWISQRRIEGKLHILFRHTDKINRVLKQELGFDILNDGSNIVLAPSVHPEGQQYKILADIAERPHMPATVADRINHTLGLYDELAGCLSKCRHPFRGLWDSVFSNKKHANYHNTALFRDASGRGRTLAFFAELKNAGASLEAMRLACQMIYGDEFDEALTREQLDHINDEATAKNDTIKADPVLFEFYNSALAKKEAKSLAGNKSANKENLPTSLEMQLEEDEDEKDYTKEDLEAARLEAIEILVSGDPIQYILNVILQYHTGDEATEEGICISIAGQSCLNTMGIQISVNGESGTGKSHAVKVHLHLVPAKYKKVTSLSAKAAYYMGLKPGTIIFSDDTSPSEVMEEVIKRATTNYQEWTEHTTVKDQKVARFLLPPRINWYLTSVNSDVSDQLLNRQLTFNTDDSVAQKDAIFYMQAKEAQSGELAVLAMTHEVLVCRRIYDIIRSRFFKVKIPYADRIELHDKSNSRTFPLFLDMIKGYTVFFHAQRDMDDEGCLIATEEDFYKAKKLFESQAEGIVSKLNEKERRIIEFIGTHRHCTVADIATATKYPYNAVRRLLKGRPERGIPGLLEKYKGLEISDETHTTEEESGYRVSKRGEFFQISGKYNYWGSFNTGFISLRKEG